MHYMTNFLFRNDPSLKSIFQTLTEDPEIPKIPNQLDTVV